MREREPNPLRKSEIKGEKKLEKILEEKGLSIKRKEGLAQIIDRKDDPVSDAFKKIYFNKEGLLIGEGKIKEKRVLNPETLDYAKIIFLDDSDGQGNTGKYHNFLYEREKILSFDSSQKAPLSLRKFLKSRGARLEKKQGKKTIVSEKTEKVLTKENYSEIYLARSGNILAKTEDTGAGSKRVEKLGEHFKPVPVSFDELKKIEGTDEYEARVGEKKMRVSFEFKSEN